MSRTLNSINREFENNIKRTGNERINIEAQTLLTPDIFGNW